MAAETISTHGPGGRSSTSSSSSSVIIPSQSDEKGRGSSASECSVEVDLEAGAVEEIKVHVAKYDRDCRICHLSMDAEDRGSGLGIELGCACKGDLAAAHVHCAEAWFKIKGDKTCEICGSTARNVTGTSESESTEQCDESNEAAAATIVPPIQSSEGRRFWKGHRFLNFLLACMVFAFVISWLFHFSVPS